MAWQPPMRVNTGQSTVPGIDFLIPIHAEGSWWQENLGAGESDGGGTWKTEAMAIY